MPVLEAALSSSVNVAGALAREVAVRGAMLAERSLSEIQAQAEGFYAGDLARDIPAETITAQAEALLLDREGLNRQLIREASPFSDGVTERIRNPAEVSVYTQVGLQETSVSDRPCLIRSDIDPGITDDYGRTNVERMQRGLSPLDSEVKTHELHHIGQAHDAPLAELTYDEHRRHSGVLHERCESQIDRAEFAAERKIHWQARALHFLA